MPFNVLDCLVKIIKDEVSNSKIVNRVTLSKTKARYMAEYGLAETYHNETVKLIKLSDAISIGFDESETMKRQEGEIVVKMAHPE